MFLNRASASGFSTGLVARWLDWFGFPALLLKQAVVSGGVLGFLFIESDIF